MGFSIPIFVCHSQVLVTHIPFSQPDNNRQIPVPHFNTNGHFTYRTCFSLIHLSGLKWDLEFAYYLFSARTSVA